MGHAVDAELLRSCGNVASCYAHRLTIGFPEVCVDDFTIIAQSQLLYDSLYYTLG